MRQHAASQLPRALTCSLCSNICTHTHICTHSCTPPVHQIAHQHAVRAPLQPAHKHMHMLTPPAPNPHPPQYIKSPISTLCVGQAASMASLLLAAGSPGERRCLPHARIMVHQPIGGAQVGAGLLACFPRHHFIRPARCCMLAAKLSSPPALTRNKTRTHTHKLAPPGPSQRHPDPGQGD